MLPNTYWQLEYIESTGTQYIDTGVVLGANDVEIEATFKYTSFTSSMQSLFGASISDKWFFFGADGSTRWKIQMGAGDTEQYISGVDTNWHNVLANNIDGNFQLDTTQLILTTTTTSINKNIYVFARNSNTGVSQQARVCVSAFKIKKSSTLVRNFIPAMRISDYAVGLYDDVNDVFYTNAGSGTFIAGNILNAPLNITFTNNPLSLVVNSDLSLIANFKLNYQITLDYDSSLGNATYDWVSGTQIQLVATPNSNAQFKGWYINSIPISTNTTYTYTVLSDTVIEARFGPVYDVATSVEGNGSIEIVRGVNDKNEITVSIITAPNNHFVKYEVSGFTLEELNLLNQNGDLLITENDNEIMAVTFDTVTEYIETPLFLSLPRNIAIKAYIEEDDKFNVTVSSNLKYASFYISDHDVYTGTPVTVWARPFPDYYFVKWSDENYDNPRTIIINNSNVTLTAIYQRVTDTNGIYQYRCYVKDQLDMTALPKAFLRVTKFTIKTDLMTNANSTIHVLEEPENLNNGDVVVLYDPKGQFLYNGVIKSIDDKKITCSQMQSFYKGLWIYNVSPQDFLEHEIAVLLQNYAQGRVYGCDYVDPLVAQRLGGITIDYVGTTTAKLPTDTDEQGNLNYTEKDMETFIYELYENYGIIFDFEINPAGANYVHIKVPNYSPVKVGDNMFAIKDMSPITTIEETNKLIIYAADKTYRTTYIATKSGIIEAPPTIVDRFDITKTKVVFSDDDISDLVANNLPSQMYNHKLTFTLLIKNFVYQFGDFNLGGQLDIYYKTDYYNSVLTGYEIRKEENKNITEADFICGKVRQKLTQLLTLGKV